MRYLLMIYSDENKDAAMSEAEMDQMMTDYYTFSTDLAEKNLDSARLQPVSTATTVRIRNGDTIVTDGPFAETKEQLGGYYLIEAADLDAAIAIAAKVPSATYGSIEVRPIWEMEG